MSARPSLASARTHRTCLSAGPLHLSEDENPIHYILGDRSFTHTRPAVAGSSHETLSSTKAPHPSSTEAPHPSSTEAPHSSSTEAPHSAPQKLHTQLHCSDGATADGLGPDSRSVGTGADVVGRGPVLESGK